MSTREMKEAAERLSDILIQIEDLKVEAKAIVDKAKESGLNTKALKKVARELCMDSVKLAQKFEDEQQLDLFRAAVKIKQRKGLEQVLEAAE